ncbi:myb-related transcription factor, partner of profilin-like [Pyxicephalus adspersus]|uniref:myb-related transcription factor, partner of profilin-like n=1 Tax=Pyxicephalus adspersus TaxID=30357 RepID=UPI003B5B626E
MEDNFLLLNSVGRYTKFPENAEKLQSGAERGLCPQRGYQREDSEKEKSDLLRDDSSQSQHGAERERQRNIRFSDEENDVLIRSVMPHYDKLFGRLAARNSTIAKNVLWREITSAVNAVSACPRSVQNCKKRFADIKRKVKEKLSRIDKHQRTSGGPGLHISFWPYERVMEKIIATDVVPRVPGTTDSGRGTGG